MIIWLASYPRSGNTFFRILLNHLYGLKTYTVYDDNDPVAQRVGPALVGYQPRTMSIAEMAALPEQFIVKTHRLPEDDSPAIYLVRDGRDSLISYGHLKTSNEGFQPGTAEYEDVFQNHVRTLILNKERPIGTWGVNVCTWFKRTAPTCRVRYSDLIQHPHTLVAEALKELEIDHKGENREPIPTFRHLQTGDDTFFRRGQVGSYRDEMLQEIESLFWQQPENQEAMRLIGVEEYPAQPDSVSQSV